MHVVVNHLHLSKPVPESALLALEFEVLPVCREVPGFVSAQVVQVDEEHHIMVVYGETADSLEAISKGPGGAWAREHLSPLFTKPAERYVGEVLTAPGG